MKPFHVSSNDEMWSTVLQAVNDSRLLLDSFQITDALDRPISQEEHRHFLYLYQALSKLGAEDRLVASREVVDRSFRGSKCLAGIIGQTEDVIERVNTIYAANSGREALVTGALINRFRLNLLNNLAEAVQGAYIPDPNFEPVSELHAKLFKDYLLEKLAQSSQYHDSSPNVIFENMRSEHPLPPLGLFVLMSSQKLRHPVDLLNRAFEIFKNAEDIRQHVWAVSRKAIGMQRNAESIAQANKEITSYLQISLRFSTNLLKPSAISIGGPEWLVRT